MLRRGRGADWRLEKCALRYDLMEEERRLIEPLLPNKPCEAAR